MRNNQIYTFYNERMVLAKHQAKNGSKSPLKPKMLLSFLERQKLSQHFSLVSDFTPFQQEDFYLAHTKEYVDGFFKGTKKHTATNGLQWTEQFADSLRYTSASLYHAIKYATEYPEKVCFSPVSGFHHAQSHRGLGYCTFSGQVIASVKLFREMGLCGAYVDLDGHYGNSIEDSRSFVQDLYRAIPSEIGNINPEGKHGQYISSFRRQLGLLRDAIMDKYIDYVVFCHGADSHEDDDTKGQCTTTEWLECAQIFYDFVRNIDNKRKKALPLILCLFGGYRKDDYNSVLELHTADLVTCLNTLCNQQINFNPTLKKRKIHHDV